MKASDWPAEQIELNHSFIYWLKKKTIEIIISSLIINIKEKATL